MVLSLILIPLVGAAAAWALPATIRRGWLMPGVGLCHLILTIITIARPPAPAGGGWLAMDPLGSLVLLLVSVLFLLSAVHAVGWLRGEAEVSDRVFASCMLAFLGTMTLVLLSHHLGLMWVAIEATTLASAPLIYAERSTRSLEATWKYLLVCSVGIALALLGSLFLAYASLYAGLGRSGLLFEELLRQAPRLSKSWLDAGFILIVVGYGTKMGLAPMHTWLPDAHSEAPSPVSALLSGGLLPCAFVAILRIFRVVDAGGEGEMARKVLIAMGLLSMAVAAIFMIRQRDFKRLLAYSSVEHMGILALGVGIGGAGAFGAMLHILNHGLTKGVLFLSAGNIYRAYGSKSTDKVSGAMRRLPLSGAILVAGFLAITGSPPGGPFVSIFTIASAAFSQGAFVAGSAFLALLMIIFLGMGATVLAVAQGRPSDAAMSTSYRDSVLTGAPILALMGIVLLLGLWIPGPLQAMLSNAARLLEAR